MLVSGIGTPDIGLTWRATGGRWDYYIDSVWSAAQLDSSGVGDFHEIVFTPGATTAAILKSFNFHPYYDNGLDYSYDWSVLDGSNVLTNGSLTFPCDATKNHPVTISYQGNPGQILILHIERTGGSDGTQNIAVDDITRASYEAESGYADPSSTTNALANRARELGATIVQYQAVGEIHRRKGGPHSPRERLFQATRTFSRIK